MLDSVVRAEVVEMSAAELAQAEAVIESGLRTFVDVGNALLAIRDGRGYLRQGYRAFEDYCRERWGFARSTAYQYLEAAKVVGNLSAMADILPTTERQARPLAALDPDQQREAWALAVETAPNGKVTAAHVERVVNTVTNKPFVAHNTGQNEWYTPGEYIESARRVMGGIDLDPASSVIANETVKAKKFYSKEDDGLTRGWAGRVWMNPPYAGELIGQFAERLASSVEAGTVTEAVVLVNNATETGWFARLTGVGSAVVFPRGRVKFLDPEGNPGAPLQGQAIIYIGGEPRKFLAEFTQFGWGATL